MTQEQLNSIKIKIADILGIYMPPKEALERANNIAQIFVWDDIDISDIIYFITPSAVKFGIVDMSIREKVAAQICDLGA